MKRRHGAYLCAVLFFLTIMMETGQGQTPRNFAQARRELKTWYEQANKRHGIVGSSLMLLQDNQVIALGDATGDFVTWAREFLATYIDARSG